MSNRRQFFKKALAMAGLVTFKPLAFIPTGKEAGLELFVEPTKCAGLPPIGPVECSEGAGIGRIWLASFDEVAQLQWGNGEGPAGKAVQAITMERGGAFYEYQVEPVERSELEYEQSVEFTMQMGEGMQEELRLLIDQNPKMAICKTEEGTLLAVPDHK